MSSYNYNVGSYGNSLSILFKILSRWRGSLYKLIWKDLLLYMLVYYIINLIYRFALNKTQKRTFQHFIQFADEVKRNIPFFFILGFFVAGVIIRWSKMYALIPYLHRPAFMFEGYINGKEPIKSKRLRLTLLRYLNLAWILQMRRISDHIATRFRQNNLEKSADNVETSLREMFNNFNLDPIIQNTYGKIITDSEIQTFEAIAIKQTGKKSDYIPEYWIPIQWASRLIQKACIHRYFCDTGTKNELIKELDKIRNNMHELEIYYGIMLPLVYVQVVIIAVHSFFICELFASQLLGTEEHSKGHEFFDPYVPIFTIFEFLFLMGWLKVAMCVTNPFGDDDEDFQTSDILNNNLDSTYRSVLGESEMFPDTLVAPDRQYEFNLTADEDNLEEFLDEIEYECDYLTSNAYGLKSLEMKEPVQTRILNSLKCRKTKRHINSTEHESNSSDNSHEVN